MQQGRDIGRKRPRLEDGREEREEIWWRWYEELYEVGAWLGE